MANSRPGRFWQGETPPGEQEQADLLAVENVLYLHDGVNFKRLIGTGDLSTLQGDIRGDLLTNGGMEQWQRGTGPFTAHLAYGPDRWYQSLTTSTLAISRDTADSGLGSLYCAAFVYVHAGLGTGASFNQKIEGFEALRGSVITFSMLVQSNVAGTVRLRIFDGSTSAHSAYNVAAGLEVLSVTTTLPVGATTLVVSAMFDVATAAGKLDNATLIVGSTAGRFVPLHPAGELLRCQRYCQELGGLDNNQYAGVGQATSTTAGIVIVRFPVEMAVAPTVTVSAAADWEVGTAAGAATACTALSASIITRKEMRLVIGVASGLVAGNALLLRAASSAASRITLVANP
jgi:hypothetical protein